MRRRCGRSRDTREPLVLSVAGEHAGRMRPAFELGR